MFSDSRCFLCAHLLRFPHGHVSLWLDKLIIRKKTVRLKRSDRYTRNPEKITTEGKRLCLFCETRWTRIFLQSCGQLAWHRLLLYSQVSSFTGGKIRWMHSDHLPGMVSRSNPKLCQALCGVMQVGLSYKHTRNLVSNVTVCGNAQAFDSSSLAADKARDSS